MLVWEGMSSAPLLFTGENTAPAAAACSTLPPTVTEG